MPGKRLTGFAETGRGVVAEIDTGESFSGNALIGADGVRSMVRQKLLGDGPPLFAGQVLFRALVPISAASVDLDLAAVSLWLCPGAHVVHYPVSAGRQLNIIAAAHSSWTDDGWSAAADSAEVIQHFQAAHHVLAAILAAPRSWMKWAAHWRRPARRWSKSRATLIGDAAHPMLPFLAQGAAMALEDAAVLSAVLSRDEDVPRAFATYENHRIARTGRVVRTSLRQASIYHASGPFRLARNAVFRLLGNDIFLARLAWLYGWEPPEC